MKAAEETRQKGIVEIYYYNVVIYVEIRCGEDEYLISYLRRLVAEEGKVTLKTILNWCRSHNLKARTKFLIRWDFPLHANLLNLATYCRVLWELNRNNE